MAVTAPRRLLAVVALVIGAAIAPAAAVAAEPTFGPASAAATFGVGVAVEQRVTLPDGVRRVEALVRTTGSGRILVAPVEVAGAGPTTLRYSFETPLGTLFPNTRVELGFRVTLEDGSVHEGPTATARYEDTRFAWDTLEGRHVRVHWAEGNAAFGRRVLQIGDEAVERATDLLGVSEDGLLDFFVYADDAAFQDVLGPSSRENVGGVAPGGLRTLFASISSTSVDDPWVGVVVPHELAHVVFETATRNPYHEPPTWLNEGLAVYLAEGYSFNRRSAVEQAVAGGTIIPLTALVGRFPTTFDRFGLAYGESASAVDFMIRDFGEDALVRLVRSYADGVTDDEAFRAALGVDVESFQASWYDDLGIAAPRPWGPQPAPSGPLPAGWEGPAPTPGEASPGDASPPASPGPGSPVEPLANALATLAMPLVIVGGLLLGFAAFVGIRRGAGRPPAPPPESPA